MKQLRLILIVLAVTATAAACNSDGITAPEAPQEKVMGSGGG